MTTIVNSNCIITSNSTFCFWAAFFSKADKIIAFPHTGVEVMPSGEISTWGNHPVIFKRREYPRLVVASNFSDKIEDYFEKY